ncbi:MAG: hypothetical protein ACRD6X_21075, partial [Pyrinomonadaceae bacterium]
AQDSDGQENGNEQVSADLLNSRNHRRTLIGVWEVTVTPRFCTTGDPIPNAAFQALFTFHRDSTLSAWFQNAQITLTRSPSHGLWKRERGWSDFSFKFVHLRYNSTGAFIGKQEAEGILVLSESGDEITTDSSTQIFDVNGIPTGIIGCSTSVGTRFGGL